MKRYGYYTPVNLAENILMLLPDGKVNSIIDICCGSWNLLKAAKRKYSDASIIGVDIDRESRQHQIAGSQFYIGDGRQFALNQKRIGQTYDLILSNPPFGYLCGENQKYNDKHFILQHCYSGLIVKRYEGEMTQANLFLAHTGSILLFILPSTFVQGESFRKDRHQIAGDYRICSIVKLPSNTFGQGRINTFAIIMEKGVSAHIDTNIYEAKNSDKWEIESLTQISYQDIIQGSWWLNSEPLRRKECLNLHRGTISSNDFVNQGETVLHNASKTGEIWEPSVRYYNKSKVTSNITRAKKGDILVNRVGKSAGYWCQNFIPDVAVSDCIIVIQDTSADLIEAFRKLSASDGRLKIPIRGVVTPYITAQDIRKILTKNI